uniref:Superoxide dismutase copper chaperone n=1 Tax=Haemaphysalis longicornis TaxID=44386 RepID=A0A9E8G718_HAELO|nr:superoxide dismutase 3 [Haemaphysalis longicornis]
MSADTSGSSKSKVEFDVNMTCQSCEAQVRQSLERLGVRDMVIDVQKQIVVVDTDIPFTKVQEAIQSTGKKAVLKGFGSSAGKATPSVAAAVSEMSGPSGILGVVRFTQAAEGSCIIDGVIDGLSKGATHKLRIHELGDLSNGCESTGDVFDPQPTQAGEKRPKRYGSLGEIDVDENGRSVFRRTNDTVKVWEIIGRSLVVCSESSSKVHRGDNDSCLRLACGIIARASGIAQNPKRICACDGVSVWDERDAAGSKKS